MEKRKPELSDQENVDAFNSFTPGYPYRPDVDMEEFIPDTCPNKEKVGERKYCTKRHKFCSSKLGFFSEITSAMAVAVDGRAGRTIHVASQRIGSRDGRECSKFERERWELNGKTTYFTPTRRNESSLPQSDCFLMRTQFKLRSSTLSKYSCAASL